MTSRAPILCAAMLVHLAPAAISQRPAHEEIPAEREPVEAGGILAGGWFDAWPHRHVSRRGTPFVHSFDLEPAFLGRDLLFDYRRTRTDGGRETELELELEWAFTRRLGMVVEAPLVHVDEVGSGAHAGVGDFAVSPRAQLVDTDLFLLSANLGLSVPTGDDDRDLGAGEAVLAPSFSVWADLGSWVSFQGQVGTEHGLKSGDTELSYKSALTWSFLTAGAHDAEPSHHVPGMTTLIAELTGRTVLDGASEPRTTAEILLGASYSVSGRWELRGGYQLPVGGPEDIDHALVLGAIFHF